MPPLDPGVPIARDLIFIIYLELGIVPRLPAAVLSTGLPIVAILSVSSRPCARHRDARAARYEAVQLFVTTTGQEVPEAHFSCRDVGM